MAHRILIVDDEPDVMKILAIRLRHAGYDVICAADGHKALELAVKASPEIILLDIMMPGMNGLEVKAELKENPLISSIPVIFLSADASIESKLEGFSLGANDYITKPFIHEELLARIKAVLTQKQYFEKISMTDGLTGLYNHTYFKQQLSHYYNLAKRYSKFFSLIVIDINEMKKINDVYGHSAGDCILKEFSKTATLCIRKTDILVRYGGDEFAILLPETEVNYTEILINKLKKSVSEIVVSIPDSEQEIRFSISAGAAEYDTSCKNEIDIFNRADKRLYEDKANSRC